ncbi:hypothetical protein [Nonomuraea sp. NPDC001831]|uniref:hypothetical protein n=1 Tax=Nonomuraea sp. NPDC001831 TaxID=3364340 RepID=UPI0036B575EB
MKRAVLAGLLILLLPAVVLSRPAQATSLFGPNERIVSAYQAGELSVDDMIRYGVASVTAPETVPARLRPTGPLSTNAETYLTYLSAMSAKASGAAKQVLSPPGLRSTGNSFFDCAHDEPYRFLRKDYHCWANVDNFVIFYNLDTGGGGVPPTPAEPSGRPTAIQNAVDAVSIAARTYRSMGFEISDNPAVPHAIFFGTDQFCDPVLDNLCSPKLRNPFVLPIGYNFLPTILMPSNPVYYDYLPRHELFHVFQYSYWKAGKVAQDFFRQFIDTDAFGSMNWWMEATAEWAAHQTYLHAPSHVPYPSQRDMYADHVDDFLAKPMLALNGWDGLGGPRQYGAFLLPLYLTEQVGPDFVRSTWEQIRSAGSSPITAIQASLGGRDLRVLLHGFAIANYRLAAPQYGAAENGYRDPDVALWRSELEQEQATEGDSLGGARPMRSSNAAFVGYNEVASGALLPGGSSYTDFTAQQGAAPATLTIKGFNVAPGQPVPRVAWSVLVWAQAGKGSDTLSAYPTAEYVRSPDSTGTVEIENFRYPMVATLVKTRLDLRTSSAAASNDWTNPFWSVGNYVPFQRRSCALRPPVLGPPQLDAYPVGTFNAYAASTPDGWTGGDSTFSMPLPGGRTLWLFSDTFLGPLNANGTRPTTARIINNSFVLQDGDKLTTVHGGTASDPRALLPPPDGTHWYWSGDGFVTGDRLQVMFNKYRLEGTGPMPFAFDQNVVATFSLSDLTKPKSVTPLPSRAGVAWGSAILPASRSGDGYTYVYGVSDAPINKKMKVARVRGDDLRVGRWQFYTPWGWSEVEEHAAETLSGIANEYSVTPWRGQFLMVSQDSTEAFNGLINAFTSCDPFDGFTNRTPVYRMPEPGPFGSYLDGDVISYNPHVHFEQSTDASLLISYNVNSMDNRAQPDADHYRDPSIYRPRFIRVAIS